MRNEHDNVVDFNFRRLDVVGIILCSELFDMFLDAVDMGFEEFLAVVFILGIDIIDISGHRYF